MRSAASVQPDGSRQDQVRPAYLRSRSIGGIENQNISQVLMYFIVFFDSCCAMLRLGIQRDIIIGSNIFLEHCGRDIDVST